MPVLRKKKDGIAFFWIDYRKLNEVTVKDVNLLPGIDDVLNQLSKVNWFLKLHLNSGCWHVEVIPNDQNKTGNNWDCPVMIFTSNTNIA